VRLSDEPNIAQACRAAAKGGLRALEITLTTPGALEIIEELAREEKVVVGAGTVLTIDQVRQVASVGGRFILSPVFDEAVVVEAHLLGLIAIPGAGSAAEILAARRNGSQLVKIFPAGALGGAAFVRAIRGPLPDVPLIPTSGPTAENVAEYFAAGAAAVGIGTDEVFLPGLKPKDVETAARRVREAVDAARGKT
jgi:2-dehydro-3-deoxyphosphogluconate aldolase/(4S)-4-hydroxy-2-oxoglutarate aldolase